MVHGLPIIGPIVPSLIGEVAAEEAAHLIASRLPAVEESSGGEVVELAVLVELPIGDEDLVRVVLKVAEAFEDVLCDSILRLRRCIQNASPFSSRGASPTNTYILQDADVSSVKGEKEVS